MAVIVPFIQRRMWMALGISLLVALLAPSSHVPPAWWQGGWRRQQVSSKAQVELLSQLAAVLMPKTPIGELFRSFPSPDRWSGDFLEPDLTAYGVLKDPHAALFVLYDRCHEKREAVARKHEAAALLEYGPPGSHVLHISHANSGRGCKDRVCGISIPPGDTDAVATMLRDLLAQVSCGLGRVLDTTVLARMQLSGQKTCLIFSTAENFTKIVAMLQRTNSEELRDYLVAEGFNHAMIDRMQEIVLLNGFSMEVKLQSKVQQWLDLGHSTSQVAEMIGTSSPSLGCSIQQTLRETTRSLFERGLAQDQATMAITAFPGFMRCRIEQNLRSTVQRLLALGLTSCQVAKAIITSGVSGSAWNSLAVVQWLLDLGLTNAQVAKVVVTYPKFLSSDLDKALKPKVQWLSTLGLTQSQVVKAVAISPEILSCSIEKKLESVVRWLQDVGLNAVQIAKVVAACPKVLGCSLEQNLQPTWKWLLDLGLAEQEVAKTLLRSPSILVSSLEMKLKPTALWLRDFGMNEAQVVKVVTAFPSIFRFNLEHNLRPKAQWLLDMGLSQAQVAKTIATKPQILGCSIEKNLQPTTKWLMKLGLTPHMLAKAIATFPQLLCYSLEHNLKPTAQWLNRSEVAKTFAFHPQCCGFSIDGNLKKKAQWLLDLGLEQHEVAKVIARCPRVLSCSIAKNLQPKVQWLLESGVHKRQLAKMISSFPPLLGYSLSNNLRHKLPLLQGVLGASAAADYVARRPLVLGYSYQRISSRVEVLRVQNETKKLPLAMDLKEEQFLARFVKRSFDSGRDKKAGLCDVVHLGGQLKDQETSVSLHLSVWISYILQPSLPTIKEIEPPEYLIASPCFS